MNQDMHSIYTRAFNKCLLWLFHTLCCSCSLECPPSSQKPTKFLSFFQTELDSHLLREVISVPTALSFGSQSTQGSLLFVEPLLTMDLRVWSSVKGDWHRAGSPSIKAWTSKYGGWSQWIWFSWFHQMEGNGLKLMSRQFLQLTVEEFKKLAPVKARSFYGSYTFKRAGQLNPEQQGC